MRFIDESFAGMATSINRVVELYQPVEKRLFDDRFAMDLLPFGWRILLRLLFLPGLRSMILSLRERQIPGALGCQLCRTRYIDDVLRDALSEGIEQVVILGAGFDSRAYRIAGIERVQVFEVDLPRLRQVKQARVEAVLGRVPEHVTLVGIDFEHEKLDDVMETVGFQTGAKTLFIWEGVTQYLTEEAVDTTLRFVSEAAGEGSAIAFTYVRLGVINGSACSEVERRFVSMARRLRSPMIFGIDPASLEQYLATRGLKLVEEVGASEYRRRYLVPLGREMSISEAERAVLARVMRSSVA